MIRRGIISLAAVLAVTSNSLAEACTPIRYDMSGVSAESAARELVREAGSVELMRVVSRAAVPADRMDRIVRENYGQAYLYRFQTVEVLNGRTRGSLEVPGLDQHWLQQRIPGVPVYSPAPPDWLSERGYAALQETAIPDPSDSGSIACVAPTTFVVGEEYLVFRDRLGALTVQRVHGQMRLRRPVIEQIAGPDDPWLRQVRAAVARDPKPGATFWTYVFDAIFGLR